MHILFNNEGTPLMITSTSSFMETTGKPSDYESQKEKRLKILSPFNANLENTIAYDKYRVISWGADNKFPIEANKQISTTSVLNTGLKFLHRLTVGQGIFACKVKSWDDKGNEVFEPVTDPQIHKLINGRMIRQCLEKVCRDYLKFGNGAVQMLPNQAGNGIVGLNPLNAIYYRYTVPDEWGACKCIVSSDWPDVPGTHQNGKPAILPCLMDYDPDLHVEWLKVKGKLDKPFVYPVRDSWSNDDYYGEPIWLPSYILGWVDVAHMVPQFLKKAYQNQITWKWHVQIPYSYWEKKFPADKYKDVEARKSDINKHMDDIEANLCGLENAEKPLFTHYAINEANGKVEEEWKITALDNKYKGGENLVTSAAANSEILFSLMVNPNVLGAGMPGGSYAGNQGGSNIREAFLVNIANAWIDRQNILDPINMMLRVNGIKDVELRFRNTILTTLDTGAGTQKTLS